MLLKEAPGQYTQLYQLQHKTKRFFSQKLHMTLCNVGRWQLIAVQAYDVCTLFHVRSTEIFANVHLSLVVLGTRLSFLLATFQTTARNDSETRTQSFARNYGTIPHECQLWHYPRTMQYACAVLEGRTWVATHLGATYDVWNFCSNLFIMGTYFNFAN